MEKNGMIPRNAPITLKLSKDDFINIFKACEDRKNMLNSLQQTSDDEDIIADAGNDLIEISMIIRQLQKEADTLWGDSGWTTSDELL